jgi:hypothetical protein
MQPRSEVGPALCMCYVLCSIIIICQLSYSTLPSFFSACHVATDHCSALSAQTLLWILMQPRSEVGPALCMCYVLCSIINICQLSYSRSYSTFLLLCLPCSCWAVRSICPLNVDAALIKGLLCACSLLYYYHMSDRLVFMSMSFSTILRHALTYSSFFN